MKKSPAKKFVFCAVGKIADYWVGEPIPKRSDSNGRANKCPWQTHNTCGKKHDKTVDSLSHTAIPQISNAVAYFS